MYFLKFSSPLALPSNGSSIPSNSIPIYPSYPARFRAGRPGSYTHLDVYKRQNLNIIAVAVLTEVSCVIVVEQMEVGEETIAKAREQGVTLLRSPLPAYELALALSSLLNQK